MQNTPLSAYLLLYFYLGLRFTVYFASVYYEKWKKDYTKGDGRKWLIRLTLWPFYFALFAFYCQRVTAIRCALYYGLLPWRWYEKEKHYKGSYLRHALLNIVYALKWLFFLESKADRQFEEEVNKNF